MLEPAEALSKAINLIYCQPELAEDQYFDRLNMAFKLTFKTAPFSFAVTKLFITLKLFV